MPIIESQLNGRIATLLGNLDRRWMARGENVGVFAGTNEIPDILITQAGAPPLVIENEYQPAATVAADALGRLGANLDTAVINAAGTVNSVIALRSPTELRACDTLDEVDDLLRGGVRLEYALFAGTDADAWERFPEAGFISGNLRDLAAFVEQAAIPAAAIEQAVTDLQRGVANAAAILMEAVSLTDHTGEVIAEHLKQDFDIQTARIAATIMINALVFHQNLAGQYGLLNPTQVMAARDATQWRMVQEWDKILDINYWSIFHVARQMLIDINPPVYAGRMLRAMVDTASRLQEVAQSHDLAGTVYQKLIADRKFLATYYTRPETAALLAHLAIPDNPRWADPERVRDFRIADYACGTGTLLHAAYRRVNRLHRLSGGDPEQLHSYMMENSLTACDVLPSAAHLTASMLSSAHPGSIYQKTRTVTTEYGRTENGGVSVGSLDLLNGRAAIRALIPVSDAAAVTGTGEVRAPLNVDMPAGSQDLVIMNPPFTRAGSDWEGDERTSDAVKPFRGLSNDLATQNKMSAAARRYSAGTCAHGYAGLASYFVALADKMVRDDGTLALVLPLTAVQGSSWQGVRDLVRRGYGDVTVVSIAARRPGEQSFSADTGMAEVLLICRKSPDAVRGRGRFIALKQRPRNEMEGGEIARALNMLFANAELRTLEGGPYGGNQLVIGQSELGEVIDAPLDGGPWSAVGVADGAVAQIAFQLAQGKVALPGALPPNAPAIPISTVGEICQVGFHDANIVGRGGQAAFTRSQPSNASTYPMLWGRDSRRQRSLAVAPDSQGRVMIGKEERAAVVWDTRSHAHHSRDFGFNAQPLGVAFTERQCIGGRAWPSVKFDSREQEVAYTLWGNTTFGLLLYWWHSSRQQAGRGLMPVTAIRAMPTLDIRRLTPGQLAIAVAIFDDMRDAELLPANEAYRDDSRKELDRRVLVEMLGLPASILEPLDLLRLKWCSEPSVHGGKRTRPPGS